MHLFQYAIVQLDPKDPKNTKVIKSITEILARNEAQVRVIANREIPEEAMDDLDNIQISVRIFSTGG